MKNLNTKRTLLMGGDVAARNAMDKTQTAIEGLEMTLSQLSARLRALRASIESTYSDAEKKTSGPDSPMKPPYHTGGMGRPSLHKWNDRIFIA